MIITPVNFARLAPYAAIALLLLPFGYPNIRAASASVLDYAGEVSPTLNRPGVEQASLSSRDILWAISIRYWSEEVPTETKWIGYGGEGQRRFGVSNSYGTIFQGGLVDPLSASTHNSSLQQLYDEGLIGLGVLLVTIFLGLQVWGRRVVSARDPVALAACAVLWVLAVTGATEVTLAPGRRELALIALLLLLGALDWSDPRGDRDRHHQAEDSSAAPTSIVAGNDESLRLR